MSDEEREEVVAVSPANATDYVLLEPEDDVPPDEPQAKFLARLSPLAREGVREDDLYGVPIKRRSGRAPPRELYMIYMRFEPGGGLTVRQRGDRLRDSEDAEVAEKRLLAEIRSGNFQNINFENMVWKRPCIVAFVIDNPGWAFYSRQPERHGPARFFRRKDRVQGGSKVYDENYAFFDAKLIDLDGCQGFHCVNFVESRNGPMAPGETLDYCFQLYLETSFTLRGREETIVFLIDPDGQNQGPGV